MPVTKAVHRLKIIFAHSMLRTVGRRTSCSTCNPPNHTNARSCIRSGTQWPRAVETVLQLGAAMKSVEQKDVLDKNVCMACYSILTSIAFYIILVACLYNV